jgi:nucleotide-binding universal stress UspA family protein
MTEGTPRKRILVGTDFSEAAEHAITYAQELARELQAELVIVHAYVVPAYGLPIEGAVMASADSAAWFSDRAQRELDEVCDRHRSADVPVRGLLRLGEAHVEIAEAAESQDVDLIVVGTHGRSGLPRWLIGSVAERVVRTAHRPVLTVPPG